MAKEEDKLAPDDAASTGEAPRKGRRGSRDTARRGPTIIANSENNRNGKKRSFKYGASQKSSKAEKTELSSCRSRRQR